MFIRMYYCSIWSKYNMSALKSEKKLYTTVTSTVHSYETEKVLMVNYVFIVTNVLLMKEKNDFLEVAECNLVLFCT